MFKSYISTFILAVFSSTLFAAQYCPMTESLAIDGEAQPLLGNGYNTDRDRYQPSNCLNGTVKEIGNGIASLEATLTRDYEKVVQEEGYKVGGSVRIAWFKASAERSVSHKMTTELFSETFLLNYKVKMGNQMLSLDSDNPFNGFGTATLNTPVNFKNQCGNCYVWQTERGANLQVALHFNFTSSDYVNSFKNSAGAGIVGLKVGSIQLGGSLNAEINKLTQIVRQHGKLSIYAKQVGGAVAYLGQIFGSSQNGVYATQCGLTDISACTKALDSIIAYINSAEFINGLQTSSAPLKYYYASYSEAIPNVPDVPMELNNDILLARETLKAELTKRENALAQVNYLLQTTYLTENSLQRLNDLKTTLDIEIDNVRTQGQRCYDYLSSCVAEKNELLANLTPLTDSSTLSLSLLDGLVAYYPFNGNFQDATQNYNHGFMVGKVTFTNNRFNKANQAIYLSTGNYVRVPTSSSLNITTAYTLSAWVNVATANGYSTIIGKPWSIGYQIVLRNGTLPSICMLNACFDSYTPVNLMQWNHVVATYDGIKLRFYTNGKLDRLFEATGTVGINGYDLHVGVQPNGDGASWFTGAVDELRIYNRALTDNEVKTLFYDKSSKTAISGSTDSIKPPYKVTCQNISTNKQISIANNKTASYDCGKAGLSATTGQTLKVIVEGKKY